MSSEKHTPRLVEHTLSQHNYSVAFMSQVFAPFAKSGETTPVAAAINNTKAAFMSAVYAVQPKHTDSIELEVNLLRDGLEHLADAVKTAELKGQQNFYLAWTVTSNIGKSGSIFNRASGFARSVAEERHNADPLAAVAVNVENGARGFWHRFEDPKPTK
jgi:hypothetical protein